MRYLIPIAFALAILPQLVSCSSSSSGGGGGGSCMQVTGTGTVSGSCPVTSCTVSQSGCSFTAACNTGTASGSLSGDSITFKPDPSVTCTGTANGQSISGTCSDGCSFTIDGLTISSPEPGSGGSGGGGGSGGSGQCVDPGTACSVNGDCCGYESGAANCVNFGSDVLCAATCSTGTDCQSGCCAPLQNGGSVCGPASLCSG